MKQHKIQDTTELNQVEATLQQTERTLTTLISNLPGFVYRCSNDRDWTMSYVSDGCLRITGYSPKDFINNETLSFSDIIHPDYRDWTSWQEALGSGGHLEEEYPITTANGETRWVWERGRGIFSDDGDLLCIEGFITDITERKLAEMRLANQEEQYRQLFELSPVAILVEDMAGTILQVNNTYVQGSGYHHDELIGKNVRMFVPPENLPLVDLNIAALQTGATLEHEVASIGKGGEKRIKMLRERTVPLSNGEQGILSLAMDVTERKLAEESLLLSEKKYRSLVEHMLEGMAIISFSGEVVLWNPSAVKMFGLDTSGQSDSWTTALEYIHPSQVKRAALDMECLRNGKDVTAEYQFVGANGRTGWMEIYATKIDYDASDAILMLMRDITDRKQEEALKEFMSWHDPLTSFITVGTSR